MKPTDWFLVIAAFNNGWTFAAFTVFVAVWLYLKMRPR